MEWYEVLISILSGLAATIPLVIKLVEYVKMAVQEKNWSVLMRMIIDLISEAETRFDNGSDRKEWVMGMVERSAKTINYKVDSEQISKLVDSLCYMAKNVNIGK